MKINDVKHNHSLTDLLKILLFAILMLSPIASVATRCLYVICNKNAYQSYGGTTENKVVDNIITSTDNLVAGDTYYLRNVYANNTTGNIGNSSNCIFVDNFEVIQNTTQYDLSNTTKIGFYQIPNGNNIVYYFWYDNSNNYNFSSNSGTVIVKFSYLSNNLTTNNFLNNSNALYEKTFNNYNSLDNVFEYSVSQLENDQLFSWTSNTPVYTGVNAMCTQLGISGQAIPIILSYWLILTCIYVIIDIVIKLFTLLTHMISRKAG